MTLNFEWKKMVNTLLKQTCINTHICCRDKNGPHAWYSFWTPWPITVVSLWVYIYQLNLLFSVYVLLTINMPWRHSGISLSFPEDGLFPEWPVIYWVGQKVHWDFSEISYGKINVQWPKDWFCNLYKLI